MGIKRYNHILNYSIAAVPICTMEEDEDGDYVLAEDVAHMQSQIEQLTQDKNNLSGLIENLQGLVDQLQKDDDWHYKMSLEFALKFAKQYQSVVTN